MKPYVRILALALFVFSMASCSNDSDENMGGGVGGTSTTFKAILNGSSEMPPTGSLAGGNATLVFDNSSKTFTITLTYFGLTPTAGHVHRGAKGSNGPPVFAFSSLASPIIYTSSALSPTQEADLKANLYYVNLHTIAYPDGEIRGQLTQSVTSGGGGGGGGGGY